MKKVALPLILMLLVMGCAKETLNENNITIPSDEKLNSSENNKSATLNAEINYPDIKFKKSNSGENVYEIVLRDSSILQYQKLEISLEFTKHGAPAGQTIHKRILSGQLGERPVSYSWSSEPIQFEVPVENTILDVVLTYVSEGKKVDTYAYSIFVLKNGKSALQMPRGLIARYSFDDAHALDNSRINASIEISNDPANEIESVELRFNEPFDGPKPTQPTFQLNGKKENGNKMNGLITFSGDPSGITYSVTYILKDAKGNTIGEPQTTNVTAQSAQIQYAFIRRAVIKTITNANGSVSNKVVVDISNNNAAEIATVKVQFNEPFAGPKPIVTELVLANSKDKSGKYILVCDCTAENGICLWKESVAGYSYNITATMLDIKGNTIGEPATMTVEVEGEIKEPTILGADIISYDDGKTWTLQVKVDNAGNTIEKITGSFVVDKTAPLPIKRDFNLMLTDKGNGTRLAYSTEVQFNGNPVGLIYDGLLDITYSVSTTNPIIYRSKIRAFKAEAKEIAKTTGARGIEL